MTIAHGALVMSFDVAIVGGGPAGLSAALVLGRARKRTLLVDSARPRNAVAGHIHGFLTQDGASLDDFRAVAREQLRRYPNVEVRTGAVARITGEVDAFDLSLGEHGVARARRVLLCSGLEEELPERPGFREAWGSSILECPYCHGWEVQDRLLGYLLPDRDSLEFPLLLQAWSDRVILFTDGRAEVPEEVMRRLRERGIAVEARPVAGAVLEPGRGLVGLRLQDGTVTACDAVFTRLPQRLSALVDAMGLDRETGLVKVNELMETSVPGVSAAGDLTNQVHGAIVAAAAGSNAAHALNRSLQCGPRSARAGTRSAP